MGYSFPQCSVPNAALLEAADSIGQAFHRLGVIGHIGIDFVALKDKGQLKMWAIGLQAWCTSSFTSFQLFDFLAAGEFDPRIGTYFVPGEEGSAPHEIEANAVNEASLDVSAHYPIDDAHVEGDSAPGDHSDSASRGSRTDARHGTVDESQLQERRFTNYSSIEMNPHRRFYVSINELPLAALKTVQYAAFFHSCRVHGFCFDMQVCHIAVHMQHSLKCRKLVFI